MTNDGRMSEYEALAEANQDPLARLIANRTLIKWLEAHNIPNPWAIAPALAETTITIEQLDELRTLRPRKCCRSHRHLREFASRRGMAETVVNSTVRIFDLIRAIKDYSYMDQAPIQDVDLSAIAREHAGDVQIAAAECKRRNQTSILTLPPVSAYGSELNQVWTALIENALDAMKDRGTLRLSTRLSGQMAFVEVWDTGPGIAPELKSRIFEPFLYHQGSRARTGAGAGHGAAIVTKHSGYTHVESKPGATCVQIRLPLDQAQAY